jgi:hypothetical protein
MPGASTKYCPFCQAICDTQDTFCGKCGQPFIASAGNTVTNSAGQPQVPHQASFLPTAPASQSNPVPMPNPLLLSNTASFGTVPSSSNPTLTANTTPASSSSSPTSFPVVPPPPPSPRRQRPTKYLVIIVVLLLLLVGGAGIEVGRWSGTASLPGLVLGKAGTVQPTAHVPGGVLYQEDGSDEWKGWVGSSDWKILNGTLINDGTYDISTEPPTIVAPYQVQGSANYAVEARMRVLRQSSKRQQPPYFGFSVRGSSGGSGWQGYWASFIPSSTNALEPSVYIQNNVASDFSQSVLAHAPFDPGTDWHTYRIEVNGNDIKVLVDGALALEVQDNQFLIGGQVGFGTANTELIISSFKIIAL